MKKNQFLLLMVALILCAFCTACGAEEDGGKYKDFIAVTAETERIFAVDAVHDELRLLGMQYIDGQVVQIRAGLRELESTGSVVDVYICRADGSKELMLEGIETKYWRYTWFRCADGDWLAHKENVLVKIDKNGEVCASTSIEGQKIKDVCQMANGTIYVLAFDEDSETDVLRKVDGETIEMPEIGSVYLNDVENKGTGMFISEGEEMVYLLSSYGVQSVKPEDGSVTDVVLFWNTGFKLENVTAWDTFRMSGEKEAEIVKGANVERISWFKPAEVRKILVFGTTQIITEVVEDLIDEWLDMCIKDFNKMQEEYYVVLEAQDVGESMEDRRQRAVIELMAGKGPDIMEVKALDNTADLIEKGVMLELNPYMEKSGIREEDFFSITFEQYREGESIYGIVTEMQPIETFFPKWFLGDDENPTIEELVDLLLKCEKKVYFSNLKWNAKNILKYLLDGSEDLWGMIDWNEATCEFDTQLFRDMLKIAKQYAWDESKTDYEPLAYIIANSKFYDGDGFEMLENGYVSIGRFFDDGVHPVSHAYNTVMVNANSKYKEGAWEFLHYLLTEGQYKFTANWRIMTPTEYPVNKAAYDDWALREMEEGSIFFTESSSGKIVTNFKASYDKIYKEENGIEKYRELYDLTEERAQAIKEILENTRLVPTKTLPILEMIYEETAAYFADDKTMEEVIAIIENRVQLYLEEKNF